MGRKGTRLTEEEMGSIISRSTTPAWYSPLGAPGQLVEPSLQALMEGQEGES